MVKQHLKRLNTPNTWNLKRKEAKFIVRPKPGPHTIETSMPLLVILRDKLGIVRTAKEARKVLHEQIVMVDGIRRKDLKIPVGMFDVINLKKADLYYRVLMDSKGRLALKETSKDTEIKPCKIKAKRLVKGGKIGLTLFDGKLLVTDGQDCKVNDTIMLELVRNQIKECLKFGKGSLVLITDGKHAGTTGIIEDIREDKILIKSKGKGSFETSKEYAFVIGKDKPAIDIECE